MKNLRNKSSVLIFYYYLALDDLIALRMLQVVEEGRKIWRCLECHKESHLKTDISRHVEASHISHPGFDCQFCFKNCKTRDALRCHVNKYHKQIWINILHNSNFVILTHFQTLLVTSRPWTMRSYSGWCPWRPSLVTRRGNALNVTRMELRLIPWGTWRQTTYNMLASPVPFVGCFPRTGIPWESTFLWSIGKIYYKSVE